MNSKISIITSALLLMVAYFISSSSIEIIATISGLFCVYFVAKENIWNFPIGLVNIVLFGKMFYEAKLYADMMLQGFFFILTFYGWYIWLTNRQGKRVRPTTSLTKAQNILVFGSVLAVTGVWGYALQVLTDASIPFLDSFIASMSLVAQWLLSKKILQNWILWIIVDVLSIGMYFYKELYLVSILYAVFLVIATYGWFEWKEEYQLDKQGGLVYANN